MSSPLPFSVVVKPTGAACNLDCQYCFFLSKELLYSARSQMMGEDTMEEYVRAHLRASPDGDVTMLWQGGEPALRGLPFFRAAVDACERHRRPAQRVRHCLQTNGTLIDDEWARFLAGNGFLVGVSIDGPAPMHDAYRLNRGGRGTHSMVLRGWEALERAGVDVNVLCAVHAANQDHGAEVYRYFRDGLGARFLQFIPIVERVPAAALAQAEAGWRSGAAALLYRQEGDRVTSRSASPASYGAFLCEVFDQWLPRDVGGVFVQDFDSALSALFGAPTVCVHAPRCGANMAMEFNGDVYACDHWVEPDWLIGNIADSSFGELASSPRMREFVEKKPDLDPDCRSCPHLPLCWGGCPKDRFVPTASGARRNYLCEGYRAFYSHARPALAAMARLLRSGRPSSDIMDPRTAALLGVALPAAEDGSCAHAR
ncbi:MAG: anaerobic sulfatase maturase [Schaalia georgiae]|uniref:Anaerobic sulfatase maturase n=1 Tax=Schaalia georgiae TaxID=52768 RepID=A0A929MZ49_9ACTO|nr:anaerobic sulfatase maturase [Schaalia georgiae]MBF0939894.1 anaerobic sulfatase maturase [Schaalia georgiae]